MSENVIHPLLQFERIFEELPDGILLLDAANIILWSNSRICQWCSCDTLVGSDFYVALGSPEILGPDYCPFHTALATGNETCSRLRSHDRFFQVHAAPLRHGGDQPSHMLVTLRDVTEEAHQQQKLAAIHQAGMELADLSPNELAQMAVKDRVELLKSNILHFTKDLLNFNMVEIRMLNQKTRQLQPLLEMGMTADAANRVLYAATKDNGVTGFVAATGKSYLCEDTTQDPLYLEGAANARSSLTIPLLLHDQVIGTFNVESADPKAFSESDLQFLEVFGRDVAAALNTLELLVTEKATTAAESVEAIHSAVARPVDDILNDAVNVMERYIGYEPEVVDKLRRILSNARDIKQVIQSIGRKMAPAEALPQSLQTEERSAVSGRRVLVVDIDDNVRSAAHALLERYGCVVETAHNGEEAVRMVRAMLNDAYDTIIADIHLPDMTGYEFMLKLQEIMEPAPLVLMTGFGYDPAHTIVNARKAGLPSYAILYKPFRLDQLLKAVELTIQAPGPVGQT
jgi:two-component system, sensor histidine kinase SagS